MRSLFPSLSIATLGLFVGADLASCGGGSSSLSPGSDASVSDSPGDGPIVGADASRDAGAEVPSDAAPEAAADAGPVVCTGEGGGLAYSKYKWPLFGNMHQHTFHSLDATSFGTRATPADAYLFAKGQKSLSLGAATAVPEGPTVTIDRPLDFLAITDHSEWLGVVSGCNDATSSMYTSAECTRVRSTNPADQDAVFASLLTSYRTLCASGTATAASCAAEQRTAWLDEQAAAASAYEPCSFTSLVAFEWTSEPSGDTNHRNVFFRNATVPASPLDSETYTTTTALYTGLDQQCTGDCQALVVPHNSNQSKGVSLVLPTSASELAQMQSYQRLVEIYQHKGSSECYYAPGGAGDPACAFEYLDPGSASDTPASYVRTALENGMAYALGNGAGNPFQLGIVASTDDHNGAAGFVAEDTYAGHLGRLDDTADKRLKSYAQFGSGGLAVVWAEQNTREAIFDALERRETYGVSGPRMVVRFYQTSSTSPCTADFPKTILDANAALPMGSTFHRNDVPASAPVFAIGAWPDAAAQRLADGTTGTAGLATVQVIKAHGKAGPDGGASIVEDAPYDVAIPAAGACVTWSDPSFDPTEMAVYYVRVLQVPTWRWSHFDCQGAPATAGCGPDGGLDASIQERAWTSPIWFVP